MDELTVQIKLDPREYHNRFYFNASTTMSNPKMGALNRACFRYHAKIESYFMLGSSYPAKYAARLSIDMRISVPKVCKWDLLKELREHKIHIAPRERVSLGIPCQPTASEKGISSLFQNIDRDKLREKSRVYNLHRGAICTRIKDKEPLWHFDNDKEMAKAVLDGELLDEIINAECEHS
jgi:hypothetical protein